MSQQTFYDVLGVERGADKPVIDSAFAAMVDRYGDFDAVPESVHTAYMTLKSNEVREFYNWFIDQVDGRLPVQCDGTQKQHLLGYCKKWGYEMVEHPERPDDAFLIRRLASRPPSIPSLGSAPSEMPREMMQRPAPQPTRSAEPPPPSPSHGDDRGDGGSRWPPKPLVLGNRIYHWWTWSGRVLDVVETSAFVQLELQVDGEPQPKVWKRGELDRRVHRTGDQLQIVGLSERSRTKNYTYVGVINITRCTAANLNFLVETWINECPFSQRPQYFGVRTQRAADQLMEKYYYESVYGMFASGGADDWRCAELAQANYRTFAKNLTASWKWAHR